MYTLILLRDRFLSHPECFFHSPLSPQSYDIEGVLGLSWAFGIPTFDIIRGTALTKIWSILKPILYSFIPIFYVFFPLFYGLF